MDRYNDTDVINISKSLEDNTSYLNHLRRLCEPHKVYKRIDGKRAHTSNIPEELEYLVECAEAMQDAFELEMKCRGIQFHIREYTNMLSSDAEIFSGGLDNVLDGFHELTEEQRQIVLNTSSPIQRIIVPEPLIDRQIEKLIEKEDINLWAICKKTILQLENEHEFSMEDGDEYNQKYRNYANRVLGTVFMNKGLDLSTVFENFCNG